MAGVDVGIFMRTWRLERAEQTSCALFAKNLLLQAHRILHFCLAGNLQSPTMALPFIEIFCSLIARTGSGSFF